MATTTNTATSNPIQLMDWKTELQRGDTSPVTREVKDNELVKNQLTDLTNSNSKYIKNARLGAREQSADRGMLMSSVAAGAGERAAIDAALPIAQQDAQAFGTASRDNQQAVNTDRLADQSMYGNLVGQEVGIRANLDEAERGRSHQTSERQQQQQWQTGERESGQVFQGQQAQLDRDAAAQRDAAQMRWQAMENDLQRTFQGTENEKAQLQQRFLQFDQSMQNYNAQLSSTLSAIYSNPNLSATQQVAAAENAKKLHESMYKSYAATMSAGVPEIFWDPYQGGAGGGSMSAVTGTTQVQQPAAGGGSGGGSGGSGGDPGYSNAQTQSSGLPFQQIGNLQQLQQTQQQWPL